MNAGPGDGVTRGVAAPCASVVIPTYNRRARLARVLEALEAQRTTADFEVVVVSDGSTDGTIEYLRSDAVPLPVVVVDQSNAGPAEARNAGWRVARGELVIFLDDDVVPEPGFVAAHLAAHHRLGDGYVVIAPMLTPDDVRLSPWVAWEQAMLEKQYVLLDALPRASYRNFYTGNASLRRTYLDRVNGFDPRYQRAEDVELAYRLSRLGLQFVFCREPCGFHYAERSFDSWRRNALQYGRNDVAFAREGQADVFRSIVRNYRDRHWIRARGCPADGRSTADDARRGWGAARRRQGG